MVSLFDFYILVVLANRRILAGDAEHLTRVDAVDVADAVGLGQLVDGNVEVLGDFGEAVTTLDPIGDVALAWVWVVLIVVPALVAILGRAMFATCLTRAWIPCASLVSIASRGKGRRGQHGCGQRQYYDKQ